MRKERSPLICLVFEQFTLEHRQGKECSRDADQNVVAEGDAPERLQGEQFVRASKTFETHAANVGAQRLLAQSVIADDDVQAVAKRCLQFAEAFGGALKCRIVGDANES